jgi:conjugative transfer region protein (TIGR03748 family)
MFKRHVLLVAMGVALTGCLVQPPADHIEPTSTSQRQKEKYWSPKPEVYENQPPSKLDPVMVQTGRYSYLPAKPRIAQLNPLLAVIDVQIPESIVTVKDSAQYLLQFSGYQLTQAISHERHVTALLQHPIPEVHRHFEQVILRDALLALGGSGYRLLVDPINRLVAYERDPKYPGWSQ